MAIETREIRFRQGWTTEPPPSRGLPDVTGNAMAEDAAAGAPSAARVFVADPGESFGPLKLREVSPPYADFVCHELAGLGFTQMHYVGTGFSVLVDPADSLVVSITADVEALVHPALFDKGCLDARGRKVNRRSYRLPRDVLYISNKGVGFGDSVEKVIVGHGAPLETDNYMGGQKVAAMYYCGLTFGFDGSGKLEKIAVGKKLHKKLHCR